MREKAVSVRRVPAILDQRFHALCRIFRFQRAGMRGGSGFEIITARDGFPASPFGKIIIG